MDQVGKPDGVVRVKMGDEDNSKAAGAKGRHLVITGGLRGSADNSRASIH
jgi:hypothetical protein